VVGENVKTGADTTLVSGSGSNEAIQSVRDQIKRAYDLRVIGIWNTVAAGDTSSKTVGETVQETSDTSQSSSKVGQELPFFNDISFADWSRQPGY
jgi:hypothetical protein